MVAVTDQRLDFPAPAPHTRVTAPAAKNERSLLRGIERRLAFLIPLVVAIPTARVLVLVHHSIYNDAQSRLANAYYVFYSRDPHLASIGFVWNPLPSVVDMPLLLLKGIWPSLANQAFAANLMSCLFFALACYQLYRFLEDLGLGRATRWGLWLSFAANPLVFYYAVNGMSEMLFMFTLIITSRYLAQWLRTGGTKPLVYSGLWLGIAYLARNEAVASAIFAGPTVLIVRYLQCRKLVRKTAIQMAATDFLLFIVPVVTAFAMWALISWIIVGHPFEQFSSVYGNASQIKLAGGSAAQAVKGTRLSYAINGSQSVAPFLVPLCAVAALIGWWRRDWRFLAPVTLIASVLGFEVVAYTLNQIFPWYRYYIYASPAIVMTAACLAAKPDRPIRIRSDRGATTIRPRAFSAVAGLVAVAACAPGILTTVHTLSHAGIASQDRYELAYFLWPHGAEAKGDTIPQSEAAVAKLAKQLDGLHLRHGAIMVDNFTTCIVPLILDSTDPREFIIPNDQDYQAKLGVPYQDGVRYFLVPNPATNPLDALDRQFPGLYNTGQGLAKLDQQINLPGCPAFRLYKLIPQ